MEQSHANLTNNGLRTEERLVEFSLHLVNRHDLERLQVQFRLLMDSQETNRWYNLVIRHRSKRVRVLFGLIQKLCEMLEFSVRCFELSIHIFDLMISKFPFEEANMLLLGLVSLQLASKMHERQESLVTYQDLRTHIYKFEMSDILSLEKLIIQQLDFKLNILGQGDFFNFFVHAFTQPGFGFFDGVPASLHQTLLRHFFKLAMQLHLITLVDYEFYQFTSFAVGFTIFGLARQLLGLPSFTVQMMAFTNTTQPNLEKCWVLLKTNYLEGLIPRVFQRLDSKSSTLALDSCTNVDFHDNFQSNIKNFFYSSNRLNGYLGSSKHSLKTRASLLSDR